jgi:C4-dicarboxylate-specific signal transduction histidine kinase
MIHTSCTVRTSVETTLELWASSLREVKGRMRPLPEMVLRQRLEAEPALANPTDKPPNRTIIKRALQVVADAKEVSHPDS